MDENENNEEAPTWMRAEVLEAVTDFRKLNSDQVELYWRRKRQLLRWASKIAGYIAAHPELLDGTGLTQEQIGASNTIGNSLAALLETGSNLSTVAANS